ncbi:MAG: hypothetical protein QW794_03225 [Thermosphaera sp.]
MPLLNYNQQGHLIVDEEVTASDIVRLQHDNFFDLKIYTGKNRTGAKLVEGVDYTLGEYDPYYQAWNAIYFNQGWWSTKLYVTYRTRGDYIDADDINALSDSVNNLNQRTTQLEQRLQGYSVGNAANHIPISNGQLNQNLNADMLDGYHASDFALKTEHEQLKSSHNFLFRVAQKRRYTRPQRVVLQVGNFSGTLKWGVGVYVSWKDETYCVPRSATSILVVSSNLSTRTFGNFSGTDKYDYGTLAKDGKIYCAPRNATQVLVIDPLNDSTQLIGDFSGSTKFSSASAVNDWVVFLPRNASYILKYNISTAQFSTVSVSWGNVMTSLVGPDGWIYFCAQQGSTWNLGKYNPDTDQIIWLQTGLSEQHKMGCVWGNKIIFGHWYSSCASAIYRILDLETGEIRRKAFSIPALTDAGPHVLGPDGLLYGFPGTGCMLVFDPETETLVDAWVIPGSGLYTTSPHRRFVFGSPSNALSLYIIAPYDETQPYP